MSATLLIMLEDLKNDECLNYLHDVIDRVTSDAQFKSLMIRPFREISFEIPIKMESGELGVFQGCRVQHNNARGPFKGGLRFNPSVSIEHFRSLASVMTWKTALVNLPFGGAKGGVNCDPSELGEFEVQQITKKYTEKMGTFLGPKVDILAPDMGTGPREMAWVFEAYARRNGHEPGAVTGKPVELGGSPMRICATGKGVAHITDLALQTQKSSDQRPIDKIDIALHGFGNVGRHTANFLNKKGARIVAVCDRDGGIHQKHGIDLAQMNENNWSLKDYKHHHPEVKVISGEELLALDVDVLIPASIEGIINEHNYNKINARLIVEGGNLPLTYEANQQLQNQGVRIVPDILANAGGVIVSYLEWLYSQEGSLWRKQQHSDRLDEILTQAFEQVSDRAERDQLSLRETSYLIALERVKTAIELRGQ